MCVSFPMAPARRRTDRANPSRDVASGAEWRKWLKMAETGWNRPIGHRRPRPKLSKILLIREIERNQERNQERERKLNKENHFIIIPYVIIHLQLSLLKHNFNELCSNLGSFIDSRISSIGFWPEKYIISPPSTSFSVSSPIANELPLQKQLCHHFLAVIRPCYPRTALSSRGKLSLLHWAGNTPMV